MSKRNIIVLAGAGVILLAIAVYQIPAINSRLAWRFEVARIYAKNLIHPVGNVPTAIPGTSEPTVAVPESPTMTLTPAILETAIPPTPTLAPPPAQARLNSP